MADLRAGDEIPFEEWVDFNFDKAADAVAQAMLTFDRFVANQQGACDTGTMLAMLNEARNRYEEASE